MLRRLVSVALPAVFTALAASPTPALVTQHFESPPVHPVELSPDGTKLFVVHTAGHELAVFDLIGGAPVRVANIPVGYEPVTVRARSDEEVWVVDHVSDAVNVVDVRGGGVVRTLLPGDEPTDVRFAANRAFVCVSQQDEIAVYDLTDLNLPPVYVALNQSDPRSLALSPEGSMLWVVALDSQNQTTAVPFATVQANGGPPPPNPPKTVPQAAPDAALIVRHDGSAWRDESGKSWSSVVPYTLLDHDVIGVDTSSLAVSAFHRGVGTTLFNVAVNPVTGVLYVTNQEATNEVRFEPNLKGKFAQNRVTTIDPVSGVVTPVHLNAHINYANPLGDAGERALSLAIPLDIAVSSAGTELYVAAMGSSKVAVLNVSGAVTRRIPVGSGPAGIALDEPRNRLYVMNRFTSTVSVVDLADDSSFEIPLGFDPSDPVITGGRELLYDGESSSAHGDLACATCHVFGAMDNIAWDLGNPQGTFVPNFPLNGFHPMKGPMTTQSLKGLQGTEPLHWRGDRADFQAFNPAFQSLMGRATQLSTAEMQAFEDFVLTMQYPPSPFRTLDGSHLSSINGADPAHGESLFLSGGLVGGLNCVSCHALPTGENGLIIPAQALLQDQDMKVPQLRNMYEKTRLDNTAGTNVRGFGYTHDGAVDDLFSFLDFPAFNFATTSDQEDVAAFLLAFATGTHVAVGAQWTMDGTNEALGIARLGTLVAEADGDEIGLIAKGRDLTGAARGWAYLGGGTWQPDRQAEPTTTLLALLAAAGSDTEVTFTAVLEGEEHRLGVDRDDDTWLDRDELDVGSDPQDPGSVPPDFVGAEIASIGRGRRLWLAGANPARRETSFGFRMDRPGRARIEVFDVTGRNVETLLRSAGHPSGSFLQSWDLRDAAGQRVSAGLYFVRLTTPDGSAAQRVVVVR
jgi:YVTN family beta-propeller protein